MSAHLWESEHPYYCNEANYFSNDCSHEYKSWAEFLEAMGDADLDMNLLFRWDWREGGDWGSGEYNGDDNYRHANFLLFFVGQRKGLFQCHDVSVCRADEPAIIEYLKPRLTRLMELWSPLLEPTDD